jgi:hypothetical protein
MPDGGQTADAWVPGSCHAAPTRAATKYATPTGPTSAARRFHVLDGANGLPGA